MKIPPILLEGDRPEVPLPSGVGQKYVVSQSPPPSAATSIESKTESSALASVGSGNLWLVARDPKTLYANWDLSEEQERSFSDKNLVLRIHQGGEAAAPITEVAIHPSVRHHFIEVGHPGSSYVADLGYLDSHHRWTSVAPPATAQTPPAVVSEDRSVQFAVLPSPPVTFEGPESPKIAPATGPIWSPQIVSSPAHSEHRVTPAPFTSLGPEELRHAALPPPSAERRFIAPTVAIEPAVMGETRMAPFAEPGRRVDLPPGPQWWTPQKEQAFAKLIPRKWGQPSRSEEIEIANLLGELFVDAGSSLAAARLVPSRPPEIGEAVSSVTFEAEKERPSPPGARGFWLNVNAELVIYGATEPDARVTIGGRPIRLRPDGTFSYRFSLPDGSYELPVVALSSASECRQVDLRFSRQTQYEGDVGAHPQDPALKPPLAANLD